MANPNPNIKNLKPIKKGQLSKAELKKRQHNGGVKSGQVRKEKKLLSQIYAEILADEKGVDGKGKTLDKVVKNILDSESFKTTSARVSMLKELREATEGSKMALMNPDGSEILSKGIKVSYE